MNKDAEQETFQQSEAAIEEEVRCRICFIEARPLVALCECAGSMAYVHEECILDWISTKMAQ
jgi:E3 ubiquitin-protein ligase DOA10